MMQVSIGGDHFCFSLRVAETDGIDIQKQITNCRRKEQKLSSCCRHFGEKSKDAEGMICQLGMKGNIYIYIYIKSSKLFLIRQIHNVFLRNYSLFRLFRGCFWFKNKSVFIPFTRGMARCALRVSWPVGSHVAASNHETGGRVWVAMLAFGRSIILSLFSRSRLGILERRFGHGEIARGAVPQDLPPVGP